MDGFSISNKIKDKALELGFSACGIANVERLQKEFINLNRWLAEGYHADMRYMARNVEMRCNPALILEDAKSVVSVLLNYFPETKQDNDSEFLVSKYAYGDDYHRVVKNKLHLLKSFILEFYPNAKMRVFTDSAPVLDRAWAVKSGLGWIGKNTLLINPKLGSFVFIGEIVVDQQLTADNPFEKEYCGKCTACIDACPTQALLEPYVLDAKRCISYQTIENSGFIPPEIASRMENLIFGCDVCQDVCPWNNKAKPTSESAFLITDNLQKINKNTFETIDFEGFESLFSESPIMRAGLLKIRQTVSQLRANVKKN
ncbi:MAG: tRNA epoxyqueuosine(34) reductase QueG [Bacteroidales bacterium]|nr:tRNA epoxyqueuosine(34) reductase QueG [Bacteroidales bacterium]